MAVEISSTSTQQGTIFYPLISQAWSKVGYVQWILVFIRTHFREQMLKDVFIAELVKRKKSSIRLGGSQLAKWLDSMYSLWEE